MRETDAVAIVTALSDYEVTRYLTVVPFPYVEADALEWIGNAYLPVIAIPSAAPDWTLARWQSEHKPRVLNAEAASADELRQRLIAVRPH
jgi:hypothetical protein